MNLIELQRALRQLRLGGTAAVLETRLRQAQTEAMAPLHVRRAPPVRTLQLVPGADREELPP